MPSNYVKVGSAWKTIGKIYVKAGSAWKTVSAGYVKVAGAWKKFFSSGSYTFSFGNTLYLNTNGFITFDSGQITTSIGSTTGTALGILPADLYLNSIRWAANSTTQFIYYRGRRLIGGVDYEIEYEIHMPDGQNYALIKLIKFPTSSYSATAFYVNGSNAGYSTVTTTRTVLSEWKVYFDSTAATSTAFTEYGSPVAALWLAAGTPNVGANDDGYYQLTTTKGTYPSAPTNVTYSSLTGTSVTISWDANTNDNSGGSAVQSYQYSTNGGTTWTSAGTNTSVALTGTYAEATDYTVKVRANNYFFSGSTTSSDWGSVTFTGPARYNVTYDGNGNTGGSVPTDTADYFSGDTVTTKTNSGSLTKTSYVFDGWNDNTSGTGTDYPTGGTFYIFGDATLYAKWVSVTAPSYVTVDATWSKDYFHTDASFYQVPGGTVSVTASADGSPAPTYAYQWQYRYTATYNDYSGATSSSWTIPSGIYGGEVRCKVTATNAGGSATGYSSTTSGPIVQPSAPPNPKAITGLYALDNRLPHGGHFYWDAEDSTVGVGSTYFNYFYSPTWGWSYTVYRSPTSGGTYVYYTSGVVPVGDPVNYPREATATALGWYYIVIAPYDDNGIDSTSTQRYPASGGYQFT